MITCPACNNASSGSQYSGPIQKCMHCGVDLPVSLRDSLIGERAESWKAKEVQEYNATTGSGNASFAISLLFLSPILIGVGLYQLYGKITSADKIIGGDAYDYLIYGIRGVAWIGIGLTCAVMACAVLLLQLAKNASTKKETSL